jgi:poly [ADP-ribose] polymerase
MSIFKSVMMVMTSVDGNNNKFWKGEVHDDGSFHAFNGRVGTKGQTQSPKYFGSTDSAERELNKKKREKIRKNYVEFDGITEGNTSDLSQSKVALEQTAMEQIRTKSDPKIIKELVANLVKKNIHSILKRTDLEYDDDTGLFKTALGFVTRDSIDKARKLISDIYPFIKAKDFNDKTVKSMLSEYLMLIPQKVGSKLSVENVLPDTKSVKVQNSILDDLQSSIEQVEASALKKKDDKTPDIEKNVFNAELSLVTDKKIIREVDNFYKNTIKTNHQCHNLRIKRVFEVAIDSMTEGYKEGVKVGNVRKLWHGTRIGNVLSILKSGMIIPPSNVGHVTGRMFGNGLYFSDISTKSLNYSYGYWDGGSKDNTCMMFLCDVAMGKEFHPSRYSGNLPRPGFDSTFALGGKAGVMNNEMIVYNLEQAIPRYLVEFG